MITGLSGALIYYENFGTRVKSRLDPLSRDRFGIHAPVRLHYFTLSYKWITSPSSNHSCSRAYCATIAGFLVYATIAKLSSARLHVT